MTPADYSKGDELANAPLPGITDRKGGDTGEWPEHLRVREFPA